MDKQKFGQGWKQSKPDNRDYTFEELKKQKEAPKPVIDLDILEHEVSINLILGCPINELSKVRKAIKVLINKFNIREVDFTERF